MKRRVFLTLIATNVPMIATTPQSANARSRQEPDLEPGTPRRVNCSFIQEMQREMDLAGIAHRDVQCPLCGEQISLIGQLDHQVA